MRTNPQGTAVLAQWWGRGVWLSLPFSVVGVGSYWLSQSVYTLDSWEEPTWWSRVCSGWPGCNPPGHQVLFFFLVLQPRLGLEHQLPSPRGVSDWRIDSKTCEGKQNRGEGTSWERSLQIGLGMSLGFWSPLITKPLFFWCSSGWSSYQKSIRSMCLIFFFGECLVNEGPHLPIHIN
jgi:hypothetical protein